MSTQTQDSAQDLKWAKIFGDAWASKEKMQAFLKDPLQVIEAYGITEIAGGHYIKDHGYQNVNAVLDPSAVPGDYNITGRGAKAQITILVPPTPPSEAGAGSIGGAQAAASCSSSSTCCTGIVSADED